MYKFRILIIFIFITNYISIYSQADTSLFYESGILSNDTIETLPIFSKSPSDTLHVLNLDSLRQAGFILLEPQKEVKIELTTEQAITLLQKQSADKYWKDPDDLLKKNIDRLLFFATAPTIDSTKHYFSTFPVSTLTIPWNNFYTWDTLRFKLPNQQPIDTSLFNYKNVAKIDSLSVIRPVFDSTKNAFTIPTQSYIVQDTAVLFASKALDKVGSDSPFFPFNYYTSPTQSDSLIVAVRTILSYLEARDSTIITISGKDNVATSVWLNSQSDAATRHWLKSDVGDSVTIWISSPEHNTLNIDLEHGVNFRKPILQSNYAEAKIEREEIDRRILLNANNITVKKQYWKTRTEASFSLNQAAMTNWVKGGENSISLLTDIVGYADYQNKEKKVTSANFARLKYGIITSGEEGIRKNVDLLETSSKISTKAFGKFDISGYLLFKTTLTKGYKYPNDSIAVSKFMNPGTFTLGIGLDYKPNKNTSMNFSPLSYKATFASDTAHIDQTLYGIEKDKKSKHEPGASFLFTNTWQMSKQLKMVNKLQLFTNYIDKPQNIDIDWEMTFTAKLNWFTDFKLNTHLIFDDNTKTIEYDKDKKPVLGDDGNPKKNARVQFKELIGFSFVFTF